jgi:hypothetical protein
LISSVSCPENRRRCTTKFLGSASVALLSLLLHTARSRAGQEYIGEWREITPAGWMGERVGEEPMRVNITRSGNTFVVDIGELGKYTATLTNVGLKVNMGILGEQLLTISRDGYTLTVGDTRLLRQTRSTAEPSGRSRPRSGLDLPLKAPLARSQRGSRDVPVTHRARAARRAPRPPAPGDHAAIVASAVEGLPATPPLRRGHSVEGPPKPCNQQPPNKQMKLPSRLAGGRRRPVIYLCSAYLCSARGQSAGLQLICDSLGSIHRSSRP